MFQQVRVSEDASESDNTNEDSKTETNNESDGNNNGFTGDRISPDLREMIQSGGSPSDRVSLILQADDIRDGRLATLLKSNGVRVDARFPAFGAIKINAPLGVIEKVAAGGNTRYLSLDRRVEAFGHVTATTGANAVRTQTVTSGFITTTTVYDGTGIGIAILDSGLDTDHVGVLKQDRSESHCP